MCFDCNLIVKGENKDYRWHFLKFQKFGFRIIVKKKQM